MAKKVFREQKSIEQLKAKLQIKNEVLSELMAEHVYLKKEIGVLYPRPGFPTIYAIYRLTSKYYNWQSRYGKVNELYALVPRDFLLEEWEKQAIIGFHLEYSLEGYRRLTTFMMLDRNIVAVSPSSLYRVLSATGLLLRWNTKTSTKETGFVQPSKAHEHWHIDVSYINICSTFYYLCSLLDGFSRYIVHSELREAMTEKDVEIILQCAHEKFPEKKPRIISDNRPQFRANDFKACIRLIGMSHVRTSPSTANLSANTRPLKVNAFAHR